METDDDFSDRNRLNVRATSGLSCLGSEISDLRLNLGGLMLDDQKACFSLYISDI